MASTSFDLEQWYRDHPGYTPPPVGSPFAAAMAADTSGAVASNQSIPGVQSVAPQAQNFAGSMLSRQTTPAPNLASIISAQRAAQPDARSGWGAFWGDIASAANGKPSTGFQDLRAQQGNESAGALALAQEGVRQGMDPNSDWVGLYRTGNTPQTLADLTGKKAATGADVARTENLQADTALTKLDTQLKPEKTAAEIEEMGARTALMKFQTATPKELNMFRDNKTGDIVIQDIAHPNDPPQRLKGMTLISTYESQQRNSAQMYGDMLRSGINPVTQEPIDKKTSTMQLKAGILKGQRDLRLAYSSNKVANMKTLYELMDRPDFDLGGLSPTAYVNDFFAQQDAALTAAEKADMEMYKDLTGEDLYPQIKQKPPVFKEKGFEHETDMEFQARTKAYTDKSVTGNDSTQRRKEYPLGATLMQRMEIDQWNKDNGF